MKNYGVAAAATSLVSAWLYLTPFNSVGSSGTSTQSTRGEGYSRGPMTAHPGSVNTYWQVRGGAHIRNATAPADIYPT